MSFSTKKQLNLSEEQKYLQLVAISVFSASDG